MFVPSLPWQNDHLYIKSGQKVPFSHLAVRAQRPALPRCRVAPAALAVARVVDEVNKTRVARVGNVCRNPFVCEFSLCLSRACLGKMIIFRTEWHRERRVSLPRAMLMQLWVALFEMKPAAGAPKTHF